MAGPADQRTLAAAAPTAEAAGPRRWRAVRHPAVHHEDEQGRADDEVSADGGVRDGFCVSGGDEEPVVRGRQLRGSQV